MSQERTRLWEEEAQSWTELDTKLDSVQRRAVSSQESADEEGEMGREPWKDG